MKKLSLLLAFLCLGILSSQAQRAAYVNMDQIMEAVPEYKEAQTELEQTAERWRQEIAKKYDEIEQMYRDYQAREVLMSDEMRKQKQDEIIAKEKQVRDLQKKRFGPEGELFSKRQSLVKPVQEKVYKAIEQLAKDRNYDFIFTAPDGSSIIYAKADKDVTEDVIKRLAD
jgi:outer membrane protein